MEENSTDAVWKEIWEKEVPASPKEIFNNRLFVEGYPVFSRFLPQQPFCLLDIGSGTGRYGVRFALDHPRSSFVLTDILDQSLFHIRSLVNAAGVKNVSVQKEDVFNLSFPDESFDIVFCDVVIQHLTDDASAVIEMARVLKPGGILLLSSANRLSVHTLVRNIQRMFGREYRYGFERLYCRSDLFRLAKESNLTVQEITGFYPAYGIYRLKRFWAGFSILGRAMNRVTRLLDVVTSGAISKHFGFELLLVAKKPT